MRPISRLRGVAAALAWLLAATAALAQDKQVNPFDTNLPNQDNSTAQSETSHAVSGATVVAAYNDSAQTTSLGFNFTSLQRFSYSTDGGTSWNDGGLVTAPAGQRLWGDPMVVVDSAGVFYMASLSGPLGSGIGGVAVYRTTSTSPTVTFGTPALINGINGTAGNGQDKEWLAVDTTGGAFDGRVYLAWSELASTTGRIEVAHSTSTTPLVFTAAAAVTASDKLHHGANLAIGPAGEVYLAWGAFDFSGGVTGGSIRLLKSTDGGSTFVNPDPADPNPNKTIVTLAVTPNLLTSGGVQIRTRDFPYLAIDRTPAGSSTRGNLYLAYQAKTDAASPDNSDIFFMSSTDGGITWSAPRTINKGPAVTSGADSTNNDNWQPAIAVSPTSGQITVTFYDRREDAANTKIRLYRAVSTDGGATWFDQPASSTSFQPKTGYDPLITASYMGDYNFATSSGSGTEATWGDERNTCTPPVGAPNPCSPSGRPDMDVFSNGTAQLHGPDLAITPWGFVTGVGPTWQTPDIFVVDASSMQVNAFKKIVNHLRARVRNVGDVASSGATVTFKYAPIFAGLTDAAFKTIGTVPQDLLPGQAAIVPIEWDLTDISDTNSGAWPAPISAFDHFCVRVTINLAGDVNPGNNQAQNNFFDVNNAFSLIGDAVFMVGNPLPAAAEAQLVLRIPRGYEASVRGVPVGERFKLERDEIRLAVLHVVPPSGQGPARTDQVAHVDFLVNGATVGGLSLRLAKANEVKPPVHLFPGGQSKVFEAILRVLEERKDGVSFADKERWLINSKPIPLSAAQLRKFVKPTDVQKIGPAGGRAMVSFKLEEAEVPAEKLEGAAAAKAASPAAAGPSGRRVLATVVSVEVLFIADSPAYVQTGGAPLASNGTLEAAYFAAIARALGIQ